MKNLYLIRHGYALHNFLYWKIGTDAYDIRDTQLLQKGVEQATNLHDTWEEKKDIELIICSPSIRTLDTALLIFGSTHHQIIALDPILEYPLGNEECNRRKDISVLKTLYPQVDFSNLKDEKLQWNYEKESLDELHSRQNKFIDWIKKRDEKNICVVSHSSFIGDLKDGIIGDEEHELKHCFPYKYVVR
jgi:broad specificity phosphatase PhoE